MKLFVVVLCFAIAADIAELNASDISYHGFYVISYILIVSRNRLFQSKFINASSTYHPTTPPVKMDGICIMMREVVVEP